MVGKRIIYHSIEASQGFLEYISHRQVEELEDLERHCKVIFINVKILASFVNSNGFQVHAQPKCFLNFVFLFHGFLKV